MFLLPHSLTLFQSIKGFFIALPEFGSIYLILQKIYNVGCSALKVLHAPGYCLRTLRKQKCLLLTEKTFFVC